MIIKIKITNVSKKTGFFSLPSHALSFPKEINPLTVKWFPFRGLRGERWNFSNSSFLLKALNKENENNFRYMIDIFSDEYFMKQAIIEANKAFEKVEVPVGAVIVLKNQIIARAHNLTETLNDVTAHAEMQAFTAAANTLGGKYLHECILYVTLEPCVMCAGAAYWTQISKIVYGAKDLKKGYSIHKSNLLHPKTIVIGNILELECSELLKSFFENKR